MVAAPTSTAFLSRPAARRWTCPLAPRDVAAFHAALPGYAPTPLVEMPALAAELGVGRLFVKDESSRLGLPAFKILGASWGVCRALCDRLGIPVPETDPIGVLRAHARAFRLVTATDGNHGRAVAAMARMLGAGADVFVPDGVHPAALAAIEAEGARVVHVRAPYDEAVRRAAEFAASPPPPAGVLEPASRSDGLARPPEPSPRATEAVLVQDTSWPGYERVPQWIVEGYSTLFAEIDAQLRAIGAGAPDLVAVPVGVGSLAQAAVTHYRSGPSAPTVLSVEPDAAPCVLTSLAADRPVTIETRPTAMSGLNCATPSALAWPYLRAGVDAAVAVAERDVADAARDLAAAGVAAGPCGAASLAGVRAALPALTSTPAPALPPPGSFGTVVLLSTESTAANPSLLR